MLTRFAGLVQAGSELDSDFLSSRCALQGLKTSQQSWSSPQIEARHAKLHALIYLSNIQSQTKDRRPVGEVDKAPLGSFSTVHQIHQMPPRLLYLSRSLDESWISEHDDAAWQGTLPFSHGNVRLPTTSDCLWPLSKPGEKQRPEPHTHIKAEICRYHEYQ